MSLYEELCALNDIPYRLENILKEVPESGLVMEFGVSTGNTIRIISNELPNRVVYGFDWWQGIPEDLCDIRGGVLTLHDPKGSFKGEPERSSLNKNVVLIDGLFADTLPGFISEHSEEAAFIHVDCDLYSSTKTVFEHLGSRIVDGTIIAFDEFIDYAETAWKYHEYKAFVEFLNKTNWKYECIAKEAPRVAFKMRR